MLKTIGTALLIWLLCTLSVLLHELGHACTFRLGGGKGSWKFLVGSGPQLFDTARLRLHLIPAGGYFAPLDDEEPRTRKGKLWMLLGGPLASLLLTLLFGVLRFAVFGSAGPEQAAGGLVYVSTFLLYFNFFQFFFTALPLRYRLVCRGLDSDGRQILRLLRQRKEKGGVGD